MYHMSNYKMNCGAVGRAGKYLLYCLVILTLSCTKNFQALNTDRTGITDGDLAADFNNIGIPLGVIQQGIYFNYDFGKGKNWPFQIMQNLNADMFSGYMHDYKPHNGGSSNSDYNLQDGWNGSNWGYTYAYVFPNLKKLADSSYMRYPAVYGLAKILKVEVMHRIADIYGPIVYYSDAGTGALRGKPVSLKEAYYAFFRDLDTAVACISGALVTKNKFPDLSGVDIMFDGDYSRWLRFANSLRMRLAVRIAMADGEKAKKEFKKGLEEPAGVLENPDENVTVSLKNGYLNPLGELNRVWNEVSMNANMESILCGYEDPRLKRYFEPCTADVIWPATSQVIPLKGRYKGIRQGTCFSHTLYFTHSKIYVNTHTEPILMTAAEVWFLRAEGALRGWSAESPEDAYRKGVTTSFMQWGVSGAPEYLQSDKTGADYTDAFDPSNNIAARCRISPKWDETLSAEMKLEKIITQKWLAIFPEGCEAWAEQRRTGYPRLFPVKINNSRNGSIDTGIMIRRLNFPGDLKDSDPQLYASLVSLLGKEDSAGSRLWWDTGRNL